MRNLPFSADRKLTEVLASTAFTISAEVIPPRNGSEQKKILDQIRQLIQAGAQFLAVTKGAGGSLRGGSLPIAQAIKDSFRIPVIAHFTCRDLTPEEVENQLIDLHYFGIRNILGLRGDPPQGQSEWIAKAGSYNFAYELIHQIASLNRNEFLKRPGGPSPDGQEGTDFCIGAAAYAEFPDVQKRISYFKKKIATGASYGITDMLFNAEVYAQFLEDAAKAGIHVPILPGTRIIKSKEQAKKMSERFKVKIPLETFNALPDTANGSDAETRGIEQFLRLTEKLKEYGAPGIHLFVISDTPIAVSALNTLSGKKMRLDTSFDE